MVTETKHLPGLTLKGCFADESLNVMNFLNEVVLRYPRAVSFAPGRPAEQHFDVLGSLGKIERFVAHRAAVTGWDRAAVYADLGQYNRTNGIIQDLVARQLEVDEGIRVAPESIVVTAGAQEGMVILLLGLFDPATDVLLSSDPTYIGITGLARIVGIPVHPIPTGEEGLAPAAVAAAIREVRRQGRVPRAVYDIPDFNNPMGTRMPLATRRALLDLVHHEGVLLFEDNPYGMFAYDGEPLPTLKSLDEHGDVVYLGSFSKTLYPGLRIGYLVADQEVNGADGKPSALAFELSKVKSLTTVTTPPLLQAIVGGLLLENGGSLQGLMAEKLPSYRENRDHMLACLAERFGGDPALSPAVRWNRPEGGFFLTLSLPFDFTEERLTVCARDYGVIVCPMSFFSILGEKGGRNREIRLSFSYVTPAQIEEGIARLARFVRDVVAGTQAGTPAAV
ncbi:MAG: (S)-3,5-dihydroxyphenylglycine transaminase [Acidobacteriota bacterium]|jgi:DNA-binding transcriptional MocR family regulator|nr:(S)-3,5-dihydroxyphenylglycine transaminase [Acidobacteriota bacterium]